nr:hypothetical protein [Tanacetum cinerariifolium]
MGDGQMRLKDCARWVLVAQAHGVLGKGYDTVSVGCRCTGRPVGDERKIALNVKNKMRVVNGHVYSKIAFVVSNELEETYDKMDGYVIFHDMNMVKTVGTANESGGLYLFDVKQC